MLQSVITFVQIASDMRPDRQNTKVVHIPAQVHQAAKVRASTLGQSLQGWLTALIRRQLVCEDKKAK